MKGEMERFWHGFWNGMLLLGIICVFAADMIRMPDILWKIPEKIYFFVRKN